MCDVNQIYKCEICGKEYKTIYELIPHIGRAHCKVKDYYDIYLKKENEEICIDCGQPTKFKKFTKGYEKYCDSCKKKHRYKDMQEALMRKYGVTNVSQLVSVKKNKRNKFKKNMVLKMLHNLI